VRGKQTTSQIDVNTRQRSLRGRRENPVRPHRVRLVRLNVPRAYSAELGERLALGQPHNCVKLTVCSRAVTNSDTARTDISEVRIRI